MEQYRAILAFISGLSGSGILLYVFVNRYSKKHTAQSSSSKFKGGLLYGLLFLGMAVVLWQKSESSILVDNPMNTVDGHAADQKTSQLQADKADSLQSMHNLQEKNLASHLKKEPVGSPDNDVGLKTIPLSEPNAIRVKSHNYRGNLNGKPNEDSKKLPVEEKIYLAVNKAFTVVEQFFNKHGVDSPSHSQQFSRKSNFDADKDLTIQFPRINFESGSANLTDQSANALKRLADNLIRYPEIKVVEIQSYSSDQSPEAFNYILSEARAQVIRDFLIAEGVQENRLIARGFGSNSNDTLRILSSRIEFVARPQ